jgi:hypothetical protein
MDDDMLWSDGYEAGKRDAIESAEWRIMETAPHDGSQIVLRIRGACGKVVIARWDIGGWWLDDGDCLSDARFEGWWPIPHL